MRQQSLSILAFCLLVIPSHVLALTQDEVFKSISDNVSGTGSADSPRLMAALMATASIVTAVAVLVNWRHRQTHRDGELHDPAKLARAVTRQAGLSRAQLRQLEALQRDLQRQGIDVQSPLTILLCPSLSQALSPQKADDLQTRSRDIVSSDPSAL